MPGAPFAVTSRESWDAWRACAPMRPRSFRSASSIVVVTSITGFRHFTTSTAVVGGLQCVDYEIRQQQVQPKHLRK